ncbi:MAG: hypothetical protein IH897_07830 [Planctomycetes bacterium]|nr:hypothetical protein [Planctomycetota bacterium]
MGRSQEDFRAFFCRWGVSLLAAALLARKWLNRATEGGLGAAESHVFGPRLCRSVCMTKKCRVTRIEGRGIGEVFARLAFTCL